MKILFSFRKSEAKSQLLQQGQIGAIQCRIFIENQTLELVATKITCKKSEWNSSEQCITGCGKSIDGSNRSLNETTVRLNRLYDILLAKFDHGSHPKLLGIIILADQS